MLSGLSGINIELTSRCNKSCHMCGRRKIEIEYPDLANWGDMPLEMVENLAKQIPKGAFVQLHNSGEPLLYPRLMEALRAFTDHHTGLNTNGKLLMKQNEAIRAHLATITISVIPDDPDGMDQLDIVREFLGYEVRPLVVFRLLGDIDIGRRVLIVQMQAQYPRVIICHRVLHAPEGSFDYEKPVTIPEIGVCLEMLHKLAVDRFGNVYPCVRFDPEKENLLGSLHGQSLASIWNSGLRDQWVRWHIEGERHRVPLCSECHFWGVPRG
jgi:radical SAM protein with 4Fe4S-binding SPASM domain